MLYRVGFNFTVFRVSLFVFFFAFLSSSAFAATVKVESKNDLKETANRFVNALSKAEVPVREQKMIKQALPGGFSRTGKEIVFSNPFFGWNLGECHRGLRKDTPMKAHIWQGASGKVWLEYDAPEASINSFGVIECGNETDKVRRALDSFVEAAVD
ncbi:MAG: hypothetical protein OEX07_09330 [Gammaproteobacteria bacterium]|nr:hypothetical protein [Gammaproteobacteria bacterium]